MSKKTFLVEIGTEELPSKSLRNLAESFSRNFILGLNNFGIFYETVRWFASPRRLALKIINLSNFESNSEEKDQKSAFSCFLKKKNNFNKKEIANNCNVTIISNQNNFSFSKEKKRFPFHKKSEKRNIKELLSEITINSLKKISILKLTNFGKSQWNFVRPIHTVTLLLNDEIIPVIILGIQSNRIIRGHRFMGESEFIIDNAEQYPNILLDRGKVIADYEKRKKKIKFEIERAADKIGGNVKFSESFLEEITSLVEWPVVLVANFKKRFLSIPIEVLIFVMKQYQKCFPVYKKDGLSLLPNFIFVANIESSNPKKIISDNENVLYSRLSDVDFFFKTDQKKRLEERLINLNLIVFQNKLGTMRDKTNRIVKLSAWIAKKIGANVNHVTRAGLLSKCDLLTNMVFEFSDTQGIIGMHCARNDGELEDVAIAIKEQYHPRFSGDQLPSNLTSCALAISDKIDTIVGIFGISLFPKGNRDPFALRRSALGVLRIIIENNLKLLDLSDLIKKSVCLYGDDKLTNKNVVSDTINFMFNRFRSWYQKKGYSIDTIQSVLSCRPTYPVDFDCRVKAISCFRILKEASLLIKINKRIKSILKKNSKILNNEICSSLLIEEEEIRLVNDFLIVCRKVESHLSEGCYQEALFELVSLYEPINNFFEKVKVNSEDEKIRINRLTLLSMLHRLFLKILDVSLLQN